MTILAFDTSSKALSVALGDGQHILVEYNQHLEYTHSEYLLTLIEQALHTAKLELTDLDGIAVVVGPGSFTGLRIGLATAKGLAVSKQIPVCGFTSLEVIAANVFDFNHLICALVPAQRGEVYAGLFSRDAAGLHLQGDYTIKDIAGLKELLPSQDAIVFVGEGAVAFHKDIITYFGQQAIMASSVCHQPHASQMLSMAEKRLSEQRDMPAVDHLLPFYMRLSAAEQRRREKEGQLSDND